MNIPLPDLTEETTAERARKVFAFTAALCLMTIPTAYFNGKVLLRWGDHAALAERVAAIRALPSDLGRWRYVRDGEPLSEGLQEQLELRGYTHRVYENVSTGQSVRVLLLVGPAGPLVRHPPEVCYENRASTMGEARDVEIGSDAHPPRLRLLAYADQSYAADNFLVAYGFGAEGHWDCPSSPRIAYGGMPALVKLQVLTDQLDDSSETGMLEFLEALLPQIVLE